MSEAPSNKPLMSTPHEPLAHLMEKVAGFNTHYGPKPIEEADSTSPQSDPGHSRHPKGHQQPSQWGKPFQPRSRDTAQPGELSRSLQGSMDPVQQDSNPESLQSSPLDRYNAEPTPANLKAVVTSLHPTIQKAVLSFPPVQTPVVHHRARLIAADAVKSWSPDSGADLKTHVFRQLQRLQHEGPKITDPLPMPERTRRDARAITDAMAAVGDTVGNEISDERISELTGIPVKRVIKVRGQIRRSTSSSAHEAGMGDDDDETPDIVAKAADPYDEWIDATYHDLGETDRLILAYRTGYRGAPVISNSEIARRLKLSPGAVSQRASNIQAKLDAFHG